MRLRSCFFTTAVALVLASSVARAADDPVEGGAPTDAAPSTEAPAASEPAAEAHLLVDAAANAALAGCKAPLSRGENDVAKACYARVQQLHPNTTAALQAALALDLLDTAKLAPPETPPMFPPGRLELAATSGLMGVWTGIAAGISVSSAIRNVEPAPAILGTGAAALVLGVGLGVGGYYLADALNLDEGGARLTASGLVWGTNFGLGMLPLILSSDVTIAPEAQASVVLGSIVAAGYAGGAIALAVAANMPVTSAQVSMLNTGGWVGSLLGVFALLDITAAGNAVNGGALSAAYLGISTLGLAGGALAGTFIDFTWGETLLLDLGGVLGLVAGGTIGLAVASQNVFPGAAGTDFATGMAGGGTLLGLGAMAATLITLRTLDNKPLLRNLGIAPTVGTPQTLIGRDGKPFMVAPMLAFTF